MEEKFIDAAEFAAGDSVADWDALLSRGAGMVPVNDRTRDSLFLKFDPLCSKRQTEVFKVPALKVSRPVDQRTPVKREELKDTTNLIPISPLPADYSGIPDKDNREEVFINSTEFASGDTVSDWDALVSRGTGIAPVINTARDSLYLKFDPLCSNSKPQNEEKEPVTVTSSSDSSTVTAPLQQNNGKITPVQEVNDNDLEAEDVNGDLNEEDVNDNAKSPLALNELNGMLEGLYLDNNSLQKKDEEFSTAVQDTQQEKLAQEEVEAIKQKVLDKIQEFEKLQQAYLKTKEDIVVIREEKHMALEDLSTMESAFTEVLLKYEGTKAVQKKFQLNEKNLQEREKVLEFQLERREEKLQHVESKCNEMTETYKRDQTTKLKQCENDNYKLKASIKMAELKTKKLEQSIEQLSLDSKNMQNLCDEMIKESKPH